MSKRITAILFPFLFLLIFFPVTSGSQAGDLELIQVFFSPEDDCGGEILKRIEGAKNAIDAAIYVFTSRSLAQALVNAQERGVKVRLCLDGEGIQAKYSKDKFLQRKKIPLRIKKDRGLMHHKFCLIDGEILITGSYNWTRSANRRNDENLIILHLPEVVRIYKDYFDRLWTGKVPDEVEYVDPVNLRKNFDE